eukprot:evm.model.scf_2108.3 EVM.evm.TU.scf_2108.3   scf_2108:18090-20197(-)
MRRLPPADGTRRPATTAACNRLLPARPRRPIGPPHSPGRRTPLPALAAPAKSPASRPARRRPGGPSPPEDPVYPEPGLWQQTLWRSFTLGGVGLHSGELSFVRVRPAHAGEGRYFVRVPPGTNGGREGKREGELEKIRVGEGGGGEGDEARRELFEQYIEAIGNDGDEGGFSGTFMDYCRVRGRASEVLARQIDPGMVPEAVRTRDRGEAFVPASIDHVAPGDNFFGVSLGDGEGTVGGVEHLLSALEACGVDNARIEVEGGPEVPVLDGSAMGWAQAIQEAGLTSATCVVGGEVARVRRSALRIEEELTVRDGDAFVSVVPADRMTLTYGIDHSKVAPVIGQQWHTWCLQDDEPYQVELAPARTYYTCIEELYALRNAGYVKAGGDDVAIIGLDDTWWDVDSVRMPVDEPVRHKLVDLIGDLSLLSLGGMSGLPFGHVVAYKANHDLHLRFVRELKERLGEGYYAGYKEDPEAPFDPKVVEMFRRKAQEISNEENSVD